LLAYHEWFGTEFPAFFTSMKGSKRNSQLFAFDFLFHGMVRNGIQSVFRSAKETESRKKIKNFHPVTFSVE
jgi:hypothetical protein